MTTIFWIAALLLPFIFLFVFTKSITNQFARMNPSDISLLSEYGFPSDAANPSAHTQALSRKTYIYFVLFAASAILLRLLPLVGKIVFYLASAFLLFLCFGQYLSFSAAKRARRNLFNKAVQSWYTPIVRIYRTLLVYSVILFILFNLFFDFVFLK